MGSLSDHFDEREFACACCGEVVVEPGLVDVLEDVRRHFGKPVTVQSGYRCAAHNADVGGATYSQHLYGKAADIVVKDTDPSEVQDYLREHAGGLGSYTSFTHVDVRGYTARWKG